MQKEEKALAGLAKKSFGVLEGGGTRNFPGKRNEKGRSNERELRKERIDL